MVPSLTFVGFPCFALLLRPFLVSFPILLQAFQHQLVACFSFPSCTLVFYSRIKLCPVVSTPSVHGRYSLRSWDGIEVDFGFCRNNIVRIFGDELSEKYCCYLQRSASIV